MSAQMRAAPPLLGDDQRAPAELSGLSLPTIRRMAASDGVVRGHVDPPMKFVGTRDAVGIGSIMEDAASTPCGRGLRLTTAIAAPRQAGPPPGTGRA